MLRSPTLEEINYLVRCVVKNSPSELSRYMEMFRMRGIQLDLNIVIVVDTRVPGTTLLHLALENEDPVRLVQYLLHYGIRHDLQDAQGRIVDFIISEFPNHEVRVRLVDLINPLPEIIFEIQTTENETGVTGASHCSSTCY